MKRASLLILLACVSLPAPVYGQVSTGTPPFGSFAGGPDVINLGNLNSHLTIPVRHKAGRGTNFTYDLTYDSSVWYPVGSSGHQNWQPVANWGWAAQTAPVLGFVTYFAQNYPIPAICRDTTTSVTQFSAFAYHDVFGVNHSFNLTVYSVDSDEPKLCQLPLGGSAAAQDGSGYNITVVGQDGPSATIIARDGSHLVPPIGTSSGAGTFTDRNGNEITVGGSGTFTDTLGTTALTASGSVPNPVKFTYTTPNNNSVSVTVTYKSYAVKTNFGCSGISEFGPTNESLVDRITLPNGSFYQFNYEPTPGFSGDYTGRLASVQLPTGGTISYQYTGGNQGIECADGSVSGFNRTTPDGTWKYARVGATTTITDPTPQANQTVITFSELANNFYEGVRAIYSGSSTGGGTLLETMTTCYNPQNNCPSPTLPIAGRSSFVEFPGGLESESYLGYNANGLVTSDVEFDYGLNAVGPILKNTIISYASLGNGIINMPASITVENSSGATVAQATFGYDAGTPVTTSGTPQHVAVSGSRGNLTSMSELVQGSNTLATSFTYFDTGNVQTATDVNGRATTFNYSNATSTCGNSFPTSVSITQPVSMSIATAWNCNGGVPNSTIDQNNQTTSYSYETMWRLAQQNSPDGGQTSYSYNDTALPASVTQTSKINSTSNEVSTVVLDGLGRTKETQLTSDSAGTDYVDTTYDSVGRIFSVSNPYRSTSDPTYGLTKYGYDALSRPTQVTDTDGSVATTSYSANCVTATDEQRKNRQTCVDALGRSTSLIENPGGLGYTTNYTYDPVGNLLTVTQNGSRQRTFAYDDLSRLTSATNPESGTVTYTYDTVSKGDLATKKDARGITTTYTYDLLHRLTEKSYSDGTPPAYFFYDQSTWNSNSLTNPKGRLTSFGTWNGSGWTTESGLSYDPMGRVLSDWQCTPIKCPWALNYQYDLAGDLISYTNGQGVTFTQTFNSAAQLTQVTSSWIDSQHPGTLATFSSYSPFGAIKSMAYGNALTETTAFNNRLQPCRINANSSGTSLNTCADAVPSGNLLDLNYSWNDGTTDNGNVMGWAAAGNQTFNRGFTYDALNRLGSMSDSDSVASCQGLTWGYDAWGNRTAQTPTKGTCGSWSVSYSAQNQISGYTYDVAGNVLNDTVHTYTYDAENRITQVDGGNTATYLYDANSLRVGKTVGSTTTSFIYDLAGRIVADYQTPPGGWWAGYVYAGNRLLAEYTNSTTYFMHTDHLGSTRLMTEVNQSIYDSMDFLPFGEQIAGGSSSSHKFTGYPRDSESNLDYATFRHYSSRQGRLMQPDPYNLGAVTANPQSWNGYAYVMNNPLRGIDPLGLNCVWDDGSYDASDDPVTGTMSGCTSQGGTWFDEITGDWSPGANATLAGEIAAMQAMLGDPSTPRIQMDVWACASCTLTAGIGVTAPSIDWTWWGTFTSNFFGNFVSGSFYRQELAPGGCLNTFARSTGSALNPFSPSVSSDAAAGAMVVGNAMRFNAARAYAASRVNVLGGPGLIFPQKSIPYNAIRGGAATTLLEGGLGYFDGAMSQGLLTEYEGAMTGTCH